MFELPGGRTLDAIYQILIPLTVDPAKAWGGYYVFDLPKAAFARRADQPLSTSLCGPAARTIASTQR